MNSRINKVIDDIEKTKNKIAELQALLPELERKRVDMENNEIIRLVRSANIKPAEFPAFIKEVKAEREGNAGLGSDVLAVEEIEQDYDDSDDTDIGNTNEEA